MSIIKPADLLNTDNVLNDLQGSAIGPLVNRSLTTTDAISSVLEAYYTPDVLAGKTRFPGYIMKSEVTDSPIIYGKIRLSSGGLFSTPRSHAGDLCGPSAARDVC